MNLILTLLLVALVVAVYFFYAKFTRKGAAPFDQPEHLPAFCGHCAACAPSGVDHAGKGTLHHLTLLHREDADIGESRAATHWPPFGG